MAFATKPTQTTKHKKRTGTHHRQDRRYLKHYWPYLPMALLVSLGLLANTVWAHHSAVLGAQSDMSVASLLSQTNQDRQAHYLSALKESSLLDQAAETKARDMVTNNYWSHSTPDGVTPWRFITNTGYKYRTAGENLAYGFESSSQTLSAWMHSPEHRANVLSGDYSQVGFGVARADNYLGKGPATVVVAMYAHPATHLTTLGLPKLSTVNGEVKGEQSQQRNVARIQVTSFGNINPTITFVATMVAIGLLTFLLTNHGLAWKRVLAGGEQFVLKHPLLDVVIVGVVMVGFVISRSAGAIL
jgi:uncharacterized protein YkwD